MNLNLELLAEQTFLGVAGYLKIGEIISRIYYQRVRSFPQERNSG